MHRESQGVHRIPGVCIIEFQGSLLLLLPSSPHNALSLSAARSLTVTSVQSVQVFSQRLQLSVFLRVHQMHNVGLDAPQLEGNKGTVPS